MDEKFFQRYSAALRKCMDVLSEDTILEVIHLIEKRETLPLVEQILKTNPTEQELLEQIRQM